MKIIFFVENNHAGGMDSFFANIVNYWPYPEDDIILICNYDHPGLANVKNSITRDCEFIDHKIYLNWQLADKFFSWLPSILRRSSQPILKILLFPYQVLKLQSLFREYKADRMMVVNGAYPGGESCRAATIAWSRISDSKSVHNIRNFAAKPRFLIKWYESRIDKKVLKSVKAFVGVSRCCSESLRVRPVFYDTNKIQYIYNGTPLNDIDLHFSHEVNLRDKLNILNDPLCLMLATYELRKGYEFIFKVFNQISSKLDNIHLVICGDSTEQEKNKVLSLRDLIAPNCKIHLLDFLPDGKNLIQQADILVVPSQEWESFGWTVIEAMARKTPVVATNSGGLAEVVGVNGVAGFSIDPDDIDSFSKAIISLIKNSGLKKVITDNGYQRAFNLFNVERMVNEYAELIRTEK